MSERLIYPADQLFVPTITGTVNISLDELDRLRIAASNAVNTAQVLESQQRMVKVVVEETFTKYETKEHPTNWHHDRGQQYQYIENKVQGKRLISMEVLNLGDIMPDLVQKATDDIKGAWDAEVQGLKNSNSKLEDKLKSVTAELDKTRDHFSSMQQERNSMFKDLTDATKEKNKALSEVAKLENREKYFWKPMQNKYTKLIDSFNKLNTRKTFWGWIQNKIAEEGEVKETKT